MTTIIDLDKCIGDWWLRMVRDGGMNSWRANIWDRYTRKIVINGGVPPDVIAEIDEAAASAMRRKDHEDLIQIP